MTTKLNLRGVHSESIVFDGSRNLFRVGQTTNQVADILHALPFIKADPVGAATDSAANALYTMKVTVQRMNQGLPSADYYDNVSGATGMPELIGGLSSTDFPLARLGMQFKVLKIDSRAGAPNTAQDSYETRLYAAAYAVARKLDTEIATGSGNTGPQRINGLANLATSAAASAMGIETDAADIIAAVTPNGTGAGEGIDCFLGGPKVMKKLMSTASGQRGMSGWKAEASPQITPKVSRKNVCSRTIRSKASINGRSHSSRMVGMHPYQ